MKARVLIVEDDAVFRRGLARMFSKDECDVTEASDGVQALEFINDALPDLVICDLRLPGIDGFAVLEQLRLSDSKTPFILVTAHYSAEVIEKAKQQGADQVLEKPIELKTLKQQCEKMLRKNPRPASQALSGC